MTEKETAKPGEPGYDAKGRYRQEVKHEISCLLLDVVTPIISAARMAGGAGLNETRGYLLSAMELVKKALEESSL